MATASPDAPLRAIRGFRQDADGHWVAELSCGHGRHMRHNPPFQERPWTQTEAGRQAYLGTEVACEKCRNDAAGLAPSGSADPGSAPGWR